MIASYSTPSRQDIDTGFLTSIKLAAESALSILTCILFLILAAAKLVAGLATLLLAIFSYILSSAYAIQHFSSNMLMLIDRIQQKIRRL